MENSILYRFRRKMQILAYDILGAKVVSKIYYRILIGKKLDLKNPKDLNAKLQWYKLYYCPRSKKIIQCADKYTMHEYIKNLGMGDHLIRLLGVWSSPSEINWDSLPEKFVLKCTHGSRYNILCTSKASLDKVQVNQQLSVWMKEDFGKYNAEPHYSNMEPRIICEEFLDDGLNDYKFFCFQGKPYFMGHYQETAAGQVIVYYYMDGSRCPFTHESFPLVAESKLPDCFDEMKKIAEVLSREFPMVRVDLYYSGGKIYVGELTFTPSGGLLLTTPRTMLDTLGEQFDVHALMTDDGGHP